LVLLGLGFVFVTLFAPSGMGGLVDRLSKPKTPEDMSKLLEVSGVSVNLDGFRAINSLTFQLG
jgi:hypothetical protein